MEGWERAWERTSVPMKPVVPVRMTFIFLSYVCKEAGRGRGCLVIGCVRGKCVTEAVVK